MHFKSPMVLRLVCIFDVENKWRGYITCALWLRSRRLWRMDSEYGSDGFEIAIAVFLFRLKHTPLRPFVPGIDGDDSGLSGHGQNSLLDELAGLAECLRG